MDTFKRTPFNIVKNLAYTLFTPVVLAFIVNILLTSFTTLSQDIIMYSALGTGILVFLGMAYSLVFSEAIKIEINETSLLYYKRNKLVGTYSFEDYNFGYRQVQQGSTTDTIDLKVQNNNTGEEFTLNCEPLGPRQFGQMFDLIQSKTFQDESIVLNAGGVQ